MAIEVKPGDTVRVSRDVTVNDQYAFRNSEQVVVESITANAERPDYKYVVFSQRLKKKFQLSDNDLILPSAVAAPAPDPIFATFPERVSPGPTKPAARSGRLAGASLKKPVLITAAIVLVIAVAVVYFSLPGASGPEATVRAFFAAGESFDIKGMVALMDPATSAQDPAQGNQLVQLFGKQSATLKTSTRYGYDMYVPYYGLNFTKALKYETTISGDTATVVASFNSSLIRGRDNPIPPNATVKFSTLNLAKKNSKWLITHYHMDY